jgi:hypothetical protein
LRTGQREWYAARPPARCPNALHGFISVFVRRHHRRLLEVNGYRVPVSDRELADWIIGLSAEMAAETLAGRIRMLLTPLGWGSLLRAQYRPSRKAHG